MEIEIDSQRWMIPNDWSMILFEFDHLSDTDGRNLAPPGNIQYP